MSWRVFLPWNALGGVAWASTIGFGVYLLGSVAEHVITIVGPIAGAVVLAIFVWVVLVRHRRAAKG
jgi:membrane protein DedA with SNARE-associated domain